MKTPSTTAAPAAGAARLADRYIRCDDFAARIDGVEFAPEVWAVFAQLAESRTERELAAHLKLDAESINAAIRRLVRRKLIRKHVLAWRDYAASQASAPIPSPARPLSAAAATIVTAPPFASHTPALATPVPTPPPAPARISAPAARSPILSLRISASPAIVRPAPLVSLRIAAPRAVTSSPVPPAPSPALEPAADAAGLRLRPVLDAIGAKAGGGVAGQLLVYRVFLQIPTELMQAAGLHSLNLVDDHYVVRHPELRAALADTARRHAGVDIEALAVA